MLEMTPTTFRYHKDRDRQTNTRKFSFQKNFTTTSFKVQRIIKQEVFKNQSFETPCSSLSPCQVIVRPVVETWASPIQWLMQVPGPG